MGSKAKFHLQSRYRLACLSFEHQGHQELGTEASGQGRVVEASHMTLPEHEQRQHPSAHSLTLGSVTPESLWGKKAGALLLTAGYTKTRPPAGYKRTPTTMTHADCRYAQFNRRHKKFDTTRHVQATCVATQYRRPHWQRVRLQITSAQLVTKQRLMVTSPEQATATTQVHTATSSFLQYVVQPGR